MLRIVSAISIVSIIPSLLNPFTVAEPTTESIAGTFEGLGYSAACVASALATCEISSKAEYLNGTKIKGTSSTFYETNFKQKFAKSCDELLAMGDVLSGVRAIHPYDCCKERKVTVFCDQETDGGGWTVIQNRDALPEREDFYRTWVEYVLGFGNVTGEYWLGLDNIHALVSSNLMELRIDLVDYDDVKRWAKYGVFYVGDSASEYKLNVGRFSGDATDQLAYHNGRKFSTHDHDNDEWGDNCSAVNKGAWWYGTCHHSNLLGYPHIAKHSPAGTGINWREFRGMDYSLKKASMKVRTLFRH